MRRFDPFWIVLVLGFGCGDPGAVLGPDGLGDLSPDLPLELPSDLEDVEPEAVVDAAEDSGLDAPAEADADAGPPGPPGLLLTVNAIPAWFNGSQPYSWDGGSDQTFRLRVNRENATLDLHLDPAAGPADWADLSLACTALVESPGGDVAEVDLPISPDDLTAGPDPAWRRYLFTPATPLPDGSAVFCAASITGPGGTADSALAFDAATLPPHLDPFTTPDTWLVVLSRDIFHTASAPLPDGSIYVESQLTPGGDGIPDFDDAFTLLGLFSPDHPEAMALVKAWLLDEIRLQTHQIFRLAPDGTPTPDGVPLRLRFEGDPDAPDPATWDGTTFSMIALGGDATPSDQAAGLVGKATLDWNNQSHEDNTIYGLGVFTTNVARQVLAQPLAVLLLEFMLPGKGLPIGAHPRDLELLAEGFDPTTLDDSDLIDRHALLTFAVEGLAKALSSTLAHEMGHSLGLVPQGPPPEGLFAGLPGLSFTDNFVVGAHIDTPGINVMQTGAVTNFLEALQQAPTFNALNMAYLRRQLVVGAP